jgi:DNA-binding XRE family transcriptional regulator
MNDINKDDFWRWAHSDFLSNAQRGVLAEYNRLAEEFSILDEFLKARAAAGITQSEVAERIGTTQSAVARLESGGGKHSPSLATLQKYAHALGCRLQLRLINESGKSYEQHRSGYF